MARDSKAMLQRRVGDALRLVPVGPNWPRWEDVYDPTTGLWHRMLRTEPGPVENGCHYSEDFDSWGKALVTVDNAADVALDGTTTLNKITETAGTGWHRVGGNTAAKTTGDVLTHKTWLMGGTRQYAFVAVWNATTGAYAYANVDLEAGFIQETATSSAGYLSVPTARIVRVPGWDMYRVHVESVVQASGDGELHGAFLALSNDGYGLPSYAGDITKHLYVWGTMFLTNVPVGHSYIPTPGAAAVSRAADGPLVLPIAPTANRQLTVMVPIMIPPHTPATDTKLFSVYKEGAAATDHVTGWLDTDGKYKLTSAASGESGGSLQVDKVIGDEDGLQYLSVHARHGELHGRTAGKHAVDKDAGIAPDLNRISIEPSGSSVGELGLLARFSREQPRPHRQHCHIVDVTTGVQRMWRVRELLGIPPDVWLDSPAPGAVSLLDRITGKVFTQAGTGNDVAVVGAPYGDKAVRGDNGKYLVAPDGVIGNIGTKDPIIVIVGKFLGTSRVARKRDGVAPNYGWDVYPSGGALNCALDGPGGSAVLTAPAHGTDWSIQTLWADRDEASTNGAGFYMNTTMGSGVDPSIAVGDMDHDAAMWFGASTWDHTIALVAVYSAQDLFPGGAANKALMDQVVAQLYNAWTGA